MKIGNNKFQVKFVNGKKEGVAIYWDENGRKLKKSHTRMTC